MKTINESEIKYLAGLLDADGSLNITHNNGYLGLVLNLELSESCDKDGKYVISLANRVGNLYTRKREENWSQTNTWRVTKRSDLEQLLPRIIKHMVIKGKHWNTLLALFRDKQGIVITKEEYISLQDISDTSRLVSGGLYPKKHPTWAWATGYIEGDGWFLIRNRTKQIEMHVGVVSHSNDRVGIDLLHKAFGGVVKLDNKGYVRWIKNLGPRDKAFVDRTLPKLINHSRLKRHKMEQIVSIHSQRLNEFTAKADIIV